MLTPDIKLVGQSCRGYGKIEKINTGTIFDSCYNSIHLKLNKDNKLYIFNSSQEDNKGEGCNNIPSGYIFSGGTLPKIGDTIYFTSIYGYNSLNSYGKEVYENNKDLPDCGQYIIAPWDFSYNNPINYEIMNICKVAGKIQNITKTPDDKLTINGLNIKILSNNNEFFNLPATELIFDEKGQSKIIGVNTTYPTYTFNGKISKEYFPKEGDDFYAILDKVSKTILQVGKDNYNNYNLLQDCIGEKIENTNLISNKFKIDKGNEKIDKKLVVSKKSIKTEQAQTGTIKEQIRIDESTNKTTSNSIKVNQEIKQVKLDENNGMMTKVGFNPGVYLIILLLISIGIVFLRKVKK